MPTTQYKSAKPQYQKSANHSQPPMHSTAVFEWETFLPTDYDGSEQSLTNIFKRISRDIIERPYHYDPHKLYNTTGNMMTNPRFTSANNSTPPAKINGVAVYKQNHGTGHALRQTTYTRALINTIADEGNPRGKKIASKIRDKPKLKSALELAAYCKRIGRTLDHEHDETADGRPATSPKIYSKRSADMFAKIANELGYDRDLINIIHDGMLEPSLKTKGQYKDVEGINGVELRAFTQNILMAAHLADLTRLFSVKQAYVKSSIQPYFDAGKSNQVSKALIEMGCIANSKTGNAVVQQEQGVRHTTKSINGKRLVDVVNNITQTRNELAQLKLSPAVVNPAPTLAPTSLSQTKPSYLTKTSIPNKSGNTPLDLDIQQAINSNDIIKQNKTADFLAISAVKNIMKPYCLPVTIKMVDNSRANDPRHDQHAMKVSFATPYEARSFAETLFKKHGISSLTYPGQAKTVQNNSIFLTKDDLAKLCVVTKLTNKLESGKLAYGIKSASFEQEKLTLQTDSHHSNGFGKH